MENRQMIESGSPQRDTFHQLLEDLNTQVDEYGNRSLAKVLEKHPFPIYEATVGRFRMIKEHRTDVGEFAVKVGGVAGEVVVAGFDLVWDVATAPVHLTLYPRIRHPLYKAVLARLAKHVDEKEKINYTESMATTTRPEGEHPPIADLPVSPTDAISPLPPEGVPPVQEEPVVEHLEHSPQREAFHQLMRDIFEVTEPALREETRDRLEKTIRLEVSQQ